MIYEIAQENKELFNENAIKELHRQHWELGISLRQLAKQNGVSIRTISKYFKKYGFDYRNKRQSYRIVINKKIEEKKDLILKIYLEAHTTNVHFLEILKKYNFPANVYLMGYRKYEYECKKMLSDFNLKNNKFRYVDPKLLPELYKKYRRKHVSLAKLSQECGYTSREIQRSFYQYEKSRGYFLGF